LDGANEKYQIGYSSLCMVMKRRIHNHGARAPFHSVKDFIGKQINEALEKYET
jgi:hypothetical protein